MPPLQPLIDLSTLEPTDDREWMARAECQWYTEVDFFNAQNPHEALDVCVHCPVLVECASYGLKESFGIWGGSTERQRQKERGRRLLLPRSHTAGHIARKHVYQREPEAQLVEVWFNGEKFQVPIDEIGIIQRFGSQ